MKRILLVVLILCALVAAQVSISGVYTSNIGTPNSIPKLLGFSGGDNTPVLTTSKLVDNGTTLSYTGTNMTINGAAVPTGGQTILKGVLTTTAAATDALTITGVTATSTCTFSAANAAAGTNIATSFVSAVATNSVTLTHTATAGMIYNIHCTPA